ncbi:cupin domain-containing protein [Sphingobacterium sp. UT-1RO-CII-1]|uniref:cupin domain-containing protein n=1 Tax=Sphingobacterium sp. UT-1RO-CII-1 TaxID=2995225 RepID=UPI00227AB69C|nr:cupin domain-containing protein [Sphingobacterium sp. UT-1RO-CII-1]MCY4778580.1 cupin domain-containing protein [Sphingobacterium sp. UT-1RO-CII-1]
MVFIKIKRLLLFAGLTAIGLTITACMFTKEPKKSKTPFVKGEKIVSANFVGTVWLNHLVETDTTHHVNIGSVTFEPGARTNWHYHEGGQILLVTDGKGLYQERGKPIEVIRAGEVVKCPPNIAHWHGATQTEPMTHIAIGTNTQIGSAVWLEPVTDEEFNAMHDE